MGQADEAEALALLQSPDLLARIVADFDACGLIGEATNKLVGYLAATSRKLGGPLAIVVCPPPPPAKAPSWMQCSPSCPRKSASSTAR